MLDVLGACRAWVWRKLGRPEVGHSGSAPKARPRAPAPPTLSAAGPLDRTSGPRSCSQRDLSLSVVEGRWSTALFLPGRSRRRSGEIALEPQCCPVSDDQWFQEKTRSAGLFPQRRNLMPCATPRRDQRCHAGGRLRLAPSEAPDRSAERQAQPKAAANVTALISFWCRTWHQVSTLRKQVG